MFMKAIIKHKNVQKILLTIMAVILVIAALFVMWWKGVFIDRNIAWLESEGIYEGGYYKLENRKLSVYKYDTDIDLNKVSVDDDVFQSSLTPIWSTEKNWFVQNVLIEDVDRDGVEELVALVWKHGSFGKHMPDWVKNNDIRLEQHIFIFKWDESADDKMRNLWMSSTIGYEIEGINRYGADKVLVNDKDGNSRVWYWEDFGLKLAGDAKERNAKFICAGDNLIHEWMYKYGDEDNSQKESRVDFAFDSYYSHIKDYINEADYKVVCQETVLTDDENMLSDYPRFAVPSNVGRALSNAGFNVFLLANNHILDKGMAGVNSTYDALIDKEGNKDSGNAICLGATSQESYEEDFRRGIHFLVKNNVRVALLDYTESTNGMPEPEGYEYLVERIGNHERVINQIRYARNRADAVIVFVHWGEEYMVEPSDSQKIHAELLADNGVDVIVGSHPHVLQPTDVLGGNSGQKTIVYYSLGNFVSGQDKEGTEIGGLADFVVEVDMSGNVEIKDNGITQTYMHQDKDECAVYLYDEYIEDVHN